MELCVVIVVTSTTALLEVGGSPSLVRAIRDLQGYFPNHMISIAVAKENERFVRDLLSKESVQTSLLTYNPVQPSALAKALVPIIQSCQAILIHDGSRPFISPDQISRVIDALQDDVDAVRPAIAFTETLKIIDPHSKIEGTLDRNTVRRISTPELIRTSAVDLEGASTGWFVPLKRQARIKYVEGNPESLRINSIAERDLLESFLHWKEKNA
jgi:2-C-methyl-D-erythritol 4-phosphate cytidylyltransferase